MDELATLESKIKSLKTLFSLPEPLEKSLSWTQQDSNGPSKTVIKEHDTKNIDRRFDCMKI